MNDRVIPLLVGSLMMVGFAVGFGRADEPAKAQAGSDVPAALNFQVKDIDGKTVDLAKTYQGKVLLIVNTASKCGLTPQYEGLETIYQKYKDQGFEVLAFPANEFGKQEPGSNEEIKTFCSTEYHVTFPLHQKIVVKGSGIHPLYEYLTTKSKYPGAISWNFNKFLINRKGEVVARFAGDKPESEKVTKAIEAALAEPK